MNTKSLSPAALLLAAGLLLPGCIAVVAAAAVGTGVAWHLGALEATVEATPEEAIAAAKEAIADLKLNVVSVNASTIDGELIARTATDTRISIVAKREAEQVTKLTIRVGTFGDESLSMTLLEKIKANL